MRERPPSIVAIVLAAVAPWAIASGSAQNPTAARPRAPNASLTAVQGLKVGHHTLAERPTGCTVVLLDGEGAVGGVSQRGGAPGTRETDLLSPLNLVDRVNAIVFAGGSAYGLDAAQGVVRYLEERNVGFKTGAGIVPIVPSAIIFDLGFGGDSRVRPTADCGYRAATAATDGPVAEGNIGAGAGATVGKLGTMTDRPASPALRRMPMKAGVGTAAFVMPNGLVVAALAVVNAVGDIVDPASGQIVAGMRNPDGALADVRKLLRSGGFTPSVQPGQNTTLGVVATNARLSKSEINRVALMADDGIARAVVPSHTIADGDTVFALATGRWAGEANVTIIGALAADALAESIVRGAAEARSLGGVSSAREVGSVPARLK